jgi:copper chaperone CopZ
MTHTYRIDGMTCSSCAAIIRNILGEVPGVTAVEVDRPSGNAVVTMQKHIPVSRLQEALSGTRYRISEEEKPASVERMEGDELVTPKAYLPLFLIFGYITGVTLLIQLQKPAFHAMQWMSHFMAGFFLVFSFFKLLDVPSFAMSYSSYDMVARKVPAYGYIYPFIELGLGISFLIPSAHLWSNWITLIVMSVSVAGVIQSMLRKSRFRCACLGAVFKLPLSTVTLFEDLLMIGMSAAGIWMA